MRKQCKLLGVSRSSVYYKKAGECQEDRAIMHAMDKIYTEDPTIGTRKIVTILERDYGIQANRKRVQRLRRLMGLETIWCQPKRAKHEGAIAFAHRPVITA